MEMNKNTTILIVVILALVVLGAVFMMNKNSTANAPTEVTVNNTNPTDAMQPTDAMAPSSAVTDAMQPTGSAKMDGNKLVVDLAGQNDSGQSGTATLTDVDGKTTVLLSLTGGGFTSPQPAHIHMGGCPTPGAVTYPLTNVVNGESTTVLDVSLSDLETKGPFAINVHKSAADVKIYTACGDIKNKQQ